jgi:hypothetical protein
MLNRWIVSMLILLVFYATLALAQEYTASPHAITINGKRLTDFLLENRQLEGERLLEAFKQEAGIQRLTGFTSLIGANLEGIRNNIIQQRNPTPEGDPACEDARKEKIEWHEQNQGSVPEAFGKIVKYDVNKRSDDIWICRVDVCTWIDKEYYVAMVFYITWDRSLRAVQKQNGTFPDTLDFSQFPGLDLSRWGWKLHAKGGSFGFIIARENGVDMGRGNDLFQGGEDECFDIFFKYFPPQAADGLPDQLNYCMGRCDARIMNTGE